MPCSIIDLVLILGMHQAFGTVVAPIPLVCGKVRWNDLGHTVTKGVVDSLIESTRDSKDEVACPEVEDKWHHFEAGARRVAVVVIKKENYGLR